MPSPLTASEREVAETELRASGARYPRKPSSATDLPRKAREVLDSVIEDTPDAYEQAANTDK